MFLLRLIWVVVRALLAKKADHRLRPTPRRDAPLLSPRRCLTYSRAIPCPKHQSSQFLDQYGSEATLLAG